MLLIIKERIAVVVMIVRRKRNIIINPELLNINKNRIKFRAITIIHKRVNIHYMINNCKVLLIMDNNMLIILIKTLIINNSLLINILSIVMLILSNNSNQVIITTSLPASFLTNSNCNTHKHTNNNNMPNKSKTHFNQPISNILLHNNNRIMEHKDMDNSKLMEINKTIKIRDIIEKR